MSAQPVLIIDDTPVNLRLTRILLESEGYKVTTAETAEEALEVLPVCRPELVLVDIQLPGIDGLEFTRRVRGNPEFEGLTIVALTAYAMKEDERKAFEAGCDGYITKPIDTRALGEKVREYLARRKNSSGNQPAALAPSQSEIDEVRAAFLVDGREHSRRLVESLDGRFDAEEVSRVVHQWIGASGLLGYNVIARLSREVEALLRERPVENSQLREALTSLALAFASPREVADPTVPQAVLTALDGKCIAAVGLPPNQKERLSMALDRVRAQAVFLELCETPKPDIIRQCDLAVVYVQAGMQSSRWLDAKNPVFNGHPLVLAGSRDDLLPLTAASNTTAREFLIDNWEPEEALMRLSMALSSRPAAPRRPAIPAKSAGRAEVVVADDDPVVMALVRTALQNFNLASVTAVNGSDALALIRSRTPQAAILDVNMPGMDGYEVLSAIRQEGIPTAVLLLTARQQENDILRGFALGADDYVVKPFSPVELTARLKRLLGR